MFSFFVLERWEIMLAEILCRTRERHPLIHCITNTVTANDCANLLLGCGASPIMADDPGEAAEITSMCDGLVLNLGTPNPRRLEALGIAGKTADALGHPVVLDPVGVGGSVMRRTAARELLDTVRFSVIRGNATEIGTLAGMLPQAIFGTASVGGESGTWRGVDADAGTLSTENLVGLAEALAKTTGAVVLLTGVTDIVTDGATTYLVKNGHPMMRDVTGTGCQLSALVGAYVAANPDSVLTATLAAVCAMGLCGERAHARLRSEDGNATYRKYILDALYNLKPDELEKGARYEIFRKPSAALCRDRPNVGR